MDKLGPGYFLKEHPFRKLNKVKITLTSPVFVLGTEFLIGKRHREIGITKPFIQSVFHIGASSHRI